MSTSRRSASGSRGHTRHSTARLSELPPTLSVDEAGEMLGISRRSAYRAVARGEIPTLRLGRRLLVPTPRLLALLGAAGGGAPEQAPRTAGEEVEAVASASETRDAEQVVAR